MSEPFVFVTTMYAPPRTCKFCSAAAKKQCGACRGVWYCSPQCQKQHWPEHRGKECEQGRRWLERNGSSACQEIEHAAAQEYADPLTEMQFGECAAQHGDALSQLHKDYVSKHSEAPVFVFSLIRGRISVKLPSHTILSLAEFNKTYGFTGRGEFDAAVHHWINLAYVGQGRRYEVRLLAA
jgi:hypothetical protein